MKELETTSIDLAGITVKGTDFSVCGDNLGSHEIGGFTVNFSSSEYFCRYCDIQQQTFQCLPHITGFVRTPESYSEGVLPQTMGIQGSSVFND